MIGWHHRLNGHECEQALRDGEGQRSLACCSPRGHKESDTTERLNRNNEGPREVRQRPCGSLGRTSRAGGQGERQIWGFT